MKITSYSKGKFLSLSMAKVKNPASIPRFLLEKMSGIIWDGWAGNPHDGSKCNSLVCLYSIGEDPQANLYDNKVLGSGIDHPLVVIMNPK